ncbi:flagellar assembly protein FliH [Sanguibacter gelidistatuariae]|uniref:Flagellar assembly protein FliH n=1 Tax=Sanguibacter gelidistatuariae TaxID=1814289 RepID=A0A1G6PX74_9MICO|nr:FliH/SctL family protein [Sanguibacter gelidistatuariae]SDC84571.1 flagellar assembly protein FliH [Sanguibacter gelidistatuariae]
MSPETASGFGSARLTVVTDDRVRLTSERARVAGYAAGFAAGSRAAAAATQGLHEHLRREAATAEDAREAAHRAAVLALARAAEAATARVLPVLDEARDLLYSRALELARAVVGAELSDGDASATTALARAARVPHDVRVQTVRLHPSDLAALTAAGRDGSAEMTGVELVADPTLAPGDAVSTFEGGFFDARIETAFERARTALLASPALMPSFAGGL